MTLVKVGLIVDNHLKLKINVSSCEVLFMSTGPGAG